MGKVVGAIFNSLMGPITGLIVDGGKGFLTGLANLATAYIGGPGAVIARTVTAVAYALQPSQKSQTSESTIKTARPPRVSAYGASRLYGAYILYETAPDGAGVDVFAVHDGELEEVLQLYLNDDKVSLTGNYVDEGDDGRYADNKIAMYYTDGSSPGTTIAAVVAKVPSIWTTDHRGDGVVQLAVIGEAVKAKNLLDIYPNSFPLGSMAAKWQKCPDPYAVDPTDRSGWTWTENAIRHLLHYMLEREGVDYDAKIAPSLDQWKAASDICGEAVALDAGGSEERYRSCVSHMHTDPHSTVKAAILQCCDGWMAPGSDGAIVVYAGAYYEPTVNIGPDEIVAFEWQGVGVDDDAAVNELVVSYVSAPHDYNTVETDAWRDEDDISERGQVLSENFEVQVPSHSQARRLAKRHMARKNALHRGSVTTNVGGRSVRGQRFINLTIEEVGVTFYDGPVEIMSVTRNISTGGVSFEWVAADPNVDAWNPATEEGEPAPVGDRIAPTPVETPAIDTATAQLSADGTFAQIAVVIDSEARTDLVWYLRWKLASNTVWNEAEYGDVDAGTSVLLLSDAVPLNSNVDVAVAYQVGDGRTSDWSTTSTVDTTTSALAPSPNIAFTATGGVGIATGSWANSASANFGHSELWHHTTPAFGSATQIGSDYAGPAGTTETFSETLAAGTHYFWTLAYNVSGTAYAKTGPVSVTVT